MPFYAMGTYDSKGGTEPAKPVDPKARDLAVSLLRRGMTPSQIVEKH